MPDLYSTDVKAEIMTAAAASGTTSTVGRSGPVSSRSLVIGYVEYRLRRQGLVVPPELVRPTVDEEGTRSTKEEELHLALRNLGDEFESRYAEVFSEMCTPLRVTPENAEKTFQTIVDYLFESGVNWGRIVALFAFCGALAASCVEKGMSSMVDQVVNSGVQCIDGDLRKWIDSNGGWNGLLDLHRQQVERRNEENNEWSWPCISSLCGYVFSAVGMLTLTAAVLTRK